MNLIVPLVLDLKNQHFARNNGAPGEARTPDPLLRSRLSTFIKTCRSERKAGENQRSFFWNVEEPSVRFRSAVADSVLPEDHPDHVRRAAAGRCANCACAKPSVVSRYPESRAAVYNPDRQAGK
jgi:hypothetical protein